MKIIVLMIVYSVLIFLCSYIALSLSEKKSKRQQTIHPDYAVLFVKNNESSIEARIRMIAQKMLCDKSLFYELLVIDLGSEDNTLKILDFLSTEYPFIRVICKDEYLSHIANLN